MPIYHFHLLSDAAGHDPDGTELCGIAAARQAAVALAGQTLLDHPEALAKTGDWSLEVADPKGLVLYRLTLIETRSSAALT